MFFSKKEENPMEVVEKIKSKLTGNKEEDRNIIQKQLEKYRKATARIEIWLEIAKVYSERYGYEGVSLLLTFELKQEIDNLMNLVKDKKYDEAQIIGESILKIKDYFYYDTDKYFFSTDIQSTFLILNDLNCSGDNEKKKIISLPFTNVLYVLAYIARKNKDYIRAEELLKNALRFNPYIVMLWFELANIYMELDEMERFKEILFEAHEYICTCGNMNELLLGLSFYYVKVGNYELASVLAKYSRVFNDFKSPLRSEFTNNCLLGIAKYITNPEEMPHTPLQCKKIIENENLPFNFSARTFENYLASTILSIKTMGNISEELKGKFEMASAMYAVMGNEESIEKFFPKWELVFYRDNLPGIKLKTK